MFTRLIGLSAALLLPLFAVSPLSAQPNKPGQAAASHAAAPAPAAAAPHCPRRRPRRVSRRRKPLRLPVRPRLMSLCRNARLVLQRRTRRRSAVRGHGPPVRRSRDTHRLCSAHPNALPVQRAHPNRHAVPPRFNTARHLKHRPRNARKSTVCASSSNGSCARRPAGLLLHTSMNCVRSSANSSSNCRHNRTRHVKGS